MKLDSLSIAQSNKAFGERASFMVRKIPNLLGGFMAKKYISKYIKISKIGASQGGLIKDPRSLARWS